ncbi:caspase family protein [Marinobacter hydrocarbonoclasticus]|nr:caspase family protein [Marinobacter nauticus]
MPRMAWLYLLLWWPIVAAANAPELRIDPGYHVGPVNNVATLPQSKQLVSLGRDSTLRWWQGETLLHTVHLPVIGEMRVASDDTVAVIDAFHGRMYRFRSGHLVNQVSIKPAESQGHVITGTCLSLDGSRLATISFNYESRESAFRIWSTTQGTAERVSLPVDSPSRCLFAPNNDLILMSYGPAQTSPGGTPAEDHFVLQLARLDSQFRIKAQHRMTLPGVLQNTASALSLSPDGAYLAAIHFPSIGFEPVGRPISLVMLDAVTLAPEAGPASAPIQADTEDRLRYDPVWHQGALWMRALDGDKPGMLSWQPGQPPQLHSRHAGPESDVDKLLVWQGQLMALSGDKGTLFNPIANTVELNLAPRLTGALQLSADGTRIGIAGQGVMDLMQRQFAKAQSLPQSQSTAGPFTPAQLAAPIRRVKIMGMDGQRRAAQWRPVPFDRESLSVGSEAEMSLVADPGHQTMLVFNGTNIHRLVARAWPENWQTGWVEQGLPDWVVNPAFEDTGVAWKQRSCTFARSIEQAIISKDRQWYATALEDGTYCLGRMSDGANLLHLYVHPHSKEWVAWTDDGYYDASPNGDTLIGYRVSNGKTAMPDIYPVQAFRKRFYRPDLASALLTHKDTAQALVALNAKTTDSIAAALPPAISITSHKDGDRFSQSQITVRYQIRNPGNRQADRIRVLLDGRPLATERGLQRQSNTNEGQITLTLPQRDVSLSLVAESASGASQPASVNLIWHGRAEFVIKPKLYLLAVGVSDYQDDTLDLRYAAKDAADFARTMAEQSGQLYREVEIKLLENADSEALLDGLDWLRAQVTSKDVAMLFLAGHGVNDADGDYFFLTADANTERLRRSAVEYHDIRKTLSNLPGKTLAFIDTCHSGNIMGGRRAVTDINAVVQDLAAAENGVVVFASATGNQYALEDPQWNNGAFTRALVEGLTGQADYTGDGAITINQLDLYLSERVKDLTGNRQTPTSTKPQTVSDFPISIKL